MTMDAAQMQSAHGVCALCYITVLLIDFVAALKLDPNNSRAMTEMARLEVSTIVLWIQLTMHGLPPPPPPPPFSLDFILRSETQFGKCTHLVQILRFLLQPCMRMWFTHTTKQKLHTVCCTAVKAHLFAPLWVLTYIKTALTSAPSLRLNPR